MGSTTPVDLASRFETGPLAFVGRQRELATLKRAVAAAQRGTGGLFLLVGEPGIGKTRLADEIFRAACDEGFEGAWGRCWEDGSAPAYWPWIQSLRTLRQTLAQSACASAFERHASRLDSFLAAHVSKAPAAAVEAARFELFDAVSQLLGELAQRQPIILILDDLHTADQPSLLLLEFVARTLSKSRLLLLGTYRSLEVERDPERAALLHRVGRSGIGLPLDGLAPHDVAVLVRGVLNTDTPDALIARVVERTEGNPLFIDEIVRLIAASDVHRWPERLPLGIREAIRERLRPLSAACVDALATAAVVGREFDVSIVAEATCLPAGTVLDHLAQATKLGLITTATTSTGRTGALRRYRFTHMLICDALQDGIDGRDQARRHRSIGAAIESVYAADLAPHLSELAHHYGLAAVDGDAEPAVRYATLAAEAAVGLLAYERAITHYNQALQALDLRHPADQEHRCRLLISRGSAERMIDGARARETLVNAAELARQLCRRAPDIGTLLLAQAAVGIADRNVGRIPSAADAANRMLFEEALMALGDREPALRATLLAYLSIEHSLDRRHAEATQRATQAVALARALGDDALLAMVLNAQYIALWFSQDLSGRATLTAEIIERAERAGNTEMATQGRAARLVDLMTFGQASAFDAELTDFAQRATVLRHPRYAWMTANLRAARALCRADWPALEALTRESFALAQSADDSNATVSPWVQLFLMRRERQHLADEETRLRFAIERFPTSPNPRCYLAIALLDLGRGEEARAEFEYLAADNFALLQQERRVGVLPLLAELSAGLGDRARAEVLYEQLKPYAHLNVPMGSIAFFGSGSRYLGILAATLGRTSIARRHFEEAVSEDERMGGTLWLAWSRFTLATHLLEDGGAADASRARTLRRQACDAARQFDLRRLESAATMAPPTVEAHPPVDLVVNSPAPASTRTVFRLDGDFWSIGAEEDGFKLKDMKGLRYLAHLLRNPRTEFHVLDLTVETDPAPDERLRASIRQAGANEALLDAKARSHYRSRLTELRDEIEEATANHDQGRLGRLHEEFEFVTGELSGALGLGGRARQVGGAAEKARVNVTRAIKAAVKRIEARDASLGRYLSTTVSTGRFCSYHPDERFPQLWEF